MGISAGAAAGISLAATVAAGAATAISNIQAGNAAAANASYQAQVARNNQTIAEQNAAAATQAGEVKAETEGAKQRARMGMILAGQAASGVDVNSGSAVDVRASQRMTDTFDTEDTLHNSYMQAYGYKTQSTNYGAQAALDTMQAREATAALPLSTTAGLLNTASSLGSKWTAFKTTGALGSG